MLVDKRRKAARRALFTLVVMGVAMLLTVFGLSLRSTPGGTPDFEEALAAPRDPHPAAQPKDAGVADVAVALAVVPAASASAHAEAEADGGDEAIDKAIAPDGGVPFHPDAGEFRSPFARPGNDPPADAKVAILVNSVDDYDITTGNFTADFFVSFTSQRPMPPLDLNFANGSVDNKEVMAEKPTFKLYRFTGKFKTPANLRKYPFDTQDLKIILEDDVHGTDQLRFTVDKERTQLARGFRAVGWQVNHIEARSLSQSYPDRFEGDDLYYSRYIFTIQLSRFATSAAFKVFVPAFVIVIISVLGMWVPPEEMEVRSNAGAPMLAGAVLFHFSLMQEVPATAYLTRADKLMLGVYMSLALGMISTWWMFLVKEQNMERVFKIARVLVPVLNVVVMALACLV